jgi:hypothetical protein
VNRITPLLAIIAGVALATHEASADDPDKAAQVERCGIRLGIAITGQAPAAAMLTGDPQSQVPAMLKTPEFREKFARFINAEYNRNPADTPGGDAPYYLAKHILEQGKPWSDLFLGPYDVSEDDKGNVTVSDKPDGLGYFRSIPWEQRYAGHEIEGLKISTAYHMLQNTIGLKLVAVTNAPNVDVSSKGRENQPCTQCHKDPWYALDKLATVLTRRNDDTDTITFDPPQGGPQTVLGGITVSDDKSLVTALVNSEAFKFRQCRIAFNYLYDRDENLCEGPIFDTCMAAFESQGTIESAIAAVAQHPSFCE